jgi:hypothetical protein
MQLFFDKISKDLYDELPKSGSAMSKVMFDIEQFNIGQSYVTAIVQDRNGDNVSINIEGGRNGIELQKNLFRTDPKPNNVYVITKLIDGGKILVRKLPVIGIKDWLLIYEDTLFLLAVKDAYDEIEMLAV